MLLHLCLQAQRAPRPASLPPRAPPPTKTPQLQLANIAGGYKVLSTYTTTVNPVRYAFAYKDMQHEHVVFKQVVGCHALLLEARMPVRMPDETRLNYMAACKAPACWRHLTPWRAIKLSMTQDGRLVFLSYLVFGCLCMAAVMPAQPGCVT